MNKELSHGIPPGYIRHWLVTGPRVTLYDGPPKEENALRREALDPRIVVPPESATLNAQGPLGEPWRMYYPGENFFVEFSTFHSRLVMLDSYAFVEIESEQDAKREARFWVSGTADLWVNDFHITRYEVARYMYPGFRLVTVPLRRGTNRLCVRLQCFGVRDTRTLFGLEFADASGLDVRVPGCGQLMEAANWLDGVRTEGRDAVIASGPAPAGVSVTLSGGSKSPWPEGSPRLSLETARPFKLSVDVIAQGQTLHRHLEIPANRSGLAAPLPADLRTARLEFIAGLASGGNLPTKKEFLPLFARRLLGRTSEKDAAAFAATATFIERREDCADFALAALLRLDCLGLATGAESAEIRRIALAFRYWSDEPGTDAMCFGSENHSLLFHGCQLIAGRRYAADRFSNSNRTGAEQAELGATRCRQWLDKIEPRGFDEFNSGTYLPITIGALLNVVDFSGDPEMSRRAAALIDRLYEGLAAHAFEGIVISPQGRVYRNVLYPDESGTQALLSDATSKAPPQFLKFSTQTPSDAWTGDWLVFPASSPTYRPPAGLDELMAKAVSKRYPQGDVEIVLHKTPAYLLTSLSIRGSNDENQKRFAAHLQAGWAGYQQHVWQASLGTDCHVFVNHPGCSFDESQSRPGYWYGNGVLPRLRQRGEILQAIFNIPDGSEARRVGKPVPETAAEDMPSGIHPVPFVHAHWPSDAFDHQESRDHWLFGQNGGGCIGLWCSEPLTPHHDVLSDHEFRAWAGRSAWMVVCGSLEEHGSFESFIESCRARHPEFDPTALTLHANGEEPLCWKA